MKSSFPASDPLSESIVRYLAKLTYWGTRHDIIARWQRELSTLTPAEISFRLSDDFDQSILYLPLAFHYLENASSTEIVSNAVSRFLGSWRKELSTNGLQGLVEERCRSLFQYWLGTFPAHGNSTEFRVRESLTDRFAPLTSIYLLNALVEQKVPDAETPHNLLADKLFKDLCEQRSSAMVSANLLAFLLKAKTTESDWQIYRHPTVRSAAFNIELCKILSQNAKACLEERCERDYLELLSVQLRGDSEFF